MAGESVRLTLETRYVTALAWPEENAAPVSYTHLAPLIARAVMLGVQDAVHDRVAEEHVGMGHVTGQERIGAPLGPPVRKLGGTTRRQPSSHARMGRRLFCCE